MAKQITIKNFAVDILAQFNLEKGFFRTFVDLIIRPGQMIARYISGESRPIYSNVVSYLIFSMTFAAASYFGLDYLLEKNSTYQTPIQFDSEMAEFTSKYREVLLYLYIPIASIGSRVFFWFWRFSFVENVIANAFIMAQIIILFSIVSIVGFGLSRDALHQPTLIAHDLVILFYFIWSYVLLSGERYKFRGRKLKREALPDQMNKTRSKFMVAPLRILVRSLVYVGFVLLALLTHFLVNLSSAWTLQRFVDLTSLV